MRGDNDFILAETQNITKTLDLLEGLLALPAWDAYQTIASGTPLQSVYLGIENILRCQLRQRGIEVPRTESWHKDLLEHSVEARLVDSAEYPLFRNLLLFRHRHMHGYGHMLDTVRLRELAEASVSVCRCYVSRVLGADA